MGIVKEAFFGPTSPEDKGWHQYPFQNSTGKDGKANANNVADMLREEQKEVKITHSLIFGYTVWYRPY